MKIFFLQTNENGFGWGFRLDSKAWSVVLTPKNYPSVTLTRIFFSSLGLEFLEVFNLASVVYHLRPGQLVSDFRFQILDFRFQILDFRFQISDFRF